MKKVFISIFLSISTFFIISAFYTKANNKQPIGFSYVLTQFQEAKIDFDIRNDITELSSSLNDLNNNTSTGSNDVLGYVKSIALNIYYTIRFVVKLIIHTLVASINVIICILKCIGFDNLSYIRLTGGGMVGASGINPENLVVLRP